MSKQATLFRAWGGSKKPQRDGSAPNRGKKVPARLNIKRPASNVDQKRVSTTETACVDLTSTDAEQQGREQKEQYGFDDFQELDDFFEDDISEDLPKTEPHPSESHPATRDDPVAVHNTSILEDVPGFDAEAGRQWIYPVNYPMRDYQFNIVQKCLFKNTLVCLPTGLGKTFIAAVVMFNFYRWYPSGKVVFLAPTKPLVGQQIEACHNIMGIPQTHLAEMTGNMAPRERSSQWVSKRVFFLTPQVMQNDIARGACPAGQVCCVVFDEAHKALGNYAYCQVVRELNSCGSIFRVLALSATPGNDLKAVQQVVSNLQLSHIELRAEDSIDIQPYTHRRKVELNVVPLEGEILLVKTAFLKVLSGIIGKLAKHGVVYSANPERLSKFALLQARDGFRQRPPPSGVHPGNIESDFATAISLYHAFDLLTQHGMRSFHQYLAHTFTGSYSRTKTEIDRHPELSRLMDELHRKLTDGRNQVDAGSTYVGTSMGRSPRSSHYTSPSQSTSTHFFYSHPKLKKLEEVVLDHFGHLQRESSDATTSSSSSSSSALQTRVMIFSQYRESVQEIADMLSCHAPLVRVMSFVGHGTTGKSTSKGLTQREQTEVVRKFREGGYNTLVATCVGEEGLDIGEVDLIVCFDAHKSPIRLVQRMGRTGRKRSGRIVVIVAQGKEEQTYRKSQSNKSSIHKAIRDNCHSLHFFPHAPRMLPRHITPQCLKQHMNIQEFVSTKTTGRGGRGKGKEKQSRLSLGPPALSKASQRGCLNREELEEWTRDFSLPDRELRACERAVNECYKPHPLLGLSHLQKRSVSRGIEDTPISSRAGPNGNASTCATPLNASVVHTYSLNLSKWVRWQTGETHCKMVGPSEKTKQFVSLLNFLDLMHSCEGLGESYGTEMAAFLNCDDIHEVTCETGDTVDSEVGVGKKVRVCKRRRLLSDSSDDGDFVEEVRQEAVGQVCHKKTPALTDPYGDTPNIATDDLGTERRIYEFVPGQPSAVGEQVSCDDDRDPLLVSQHAIPRPPSSESLDWLDNIEPSQMSTPLAPPPFTKPHPTTSSLDAFQFALPRTPSSSRKGKTPFVTPLTARLPPLRNRTDQSPQITDNVSTVQTPCHVDSVDLFNDISSAVLFEDFSDASSSLAPRHITSGVVAVERRESDVCGESGKRTCGEDVAVWLDPDITHIPDSEGEGEGEVRGGGEREEGCGGDEVRGDGDSEPRVSVCEKSSYSEDSVIGVCGRRARCARPDFLLTQAPPSQAPPSQAPPTQAPPTHSTSHSEVCILSSHSDVCVISSDSEGSEEEEKRSNGKKVGKRVRVDNSSDEDEFVAPLRRVWRRRGGRLSGGGRTCSTHSRTGKAVVPCWNENQPPEEFDFLDKEAELSDRGGGTTEDSVEEGEDCYDMEDSFINDNSVLTQQVSPSQLARSHIKGVRKTHFSPVNMPDVYRRSLMSPDTLFGGRGRRGGPGYRMVLSQRHHILRHYMEKATGRRGEMFHREGEEETSVSGEDVEGINVSGGVSGEGGEGVSGESEAEEVIVCYGEEDKEELSESQSIGEPWDWMEGAGEQEDQEMGQEEVGAMEVGRADPPSCEGQTLEEDIVSPSLLASVEVCDTPSCLTLEVEGWLSDGSSDECPAPSLPAADLAPTSLPSAGLEPTAEPDLAAEVSLSQQELEEEFDCFSDPVSPEPDLTIEVSLSQQELEEEFDCFSDPVSPQVPGPPSPSSPQQTPQQPPQQPTGSHTEAAQPLHTMPRDGRSGPESIPPAGIGMEISTGANTQALTFLTSSAEASHTQVVSTLRHKHGVCVLVCPLGHGGYVISNRMVVERREMGAVVSAVKSVVTRLQELKKFYPRVCVILEEERSKDRKKTWSKPSHSVETAVSRLHSAGVRVLFSSSHTHSASLLVSLGSSEAVRGHVVTLTEQQAQAAQPAVMKLLQHTPRMTHLTALYLCSGFTSLKELLQCSAEEMRDRVPCLSERRAREIAHFFRHSFNPHLVS